MAPVDSHCCSVTRLIFEAASSSASFSSAFYNAATIDAGLCGSTIKPIVTNPVSITNIESLDIHPTYSSAQTQLLRWTLSKLSLSQPLTAILVAN